LGGNNVFSEKKINKGISDSNMWSIEIPFDVEFRNSSNFCYKVLPDFSKWQNDQSLIKARLSYRNCVVNKFQIFFLMKVWVLFVTFEFIRQVTMG
jgi:hypothetical protein